MICRFVEGRTVGKGRLWGVIRYCCVNVVCGGEASVAELRTEAGFRMSPWQRGRLSSMQRNEVVLIDACDVQACAV